MEESEGALEFALSKGGPDERVVAERVLEDYRRYFSWESRHSALMRPVGDASYVPLQLRELRSVVGSLIHKTALVNYLKTRGSLRDFERRTLLKIFHGSADYSNAVLWEHRTYIVAASSQLCVRRLLKRLGDANGLELAAKYETSYERYFFAFCDSAIADIRGAENPMKPLLSELKQLAAARSAALSGFSALRGNGATTTKVPHTLVSSV